MHAQTAARFERLREAVRPYGVFTPAQAKQHGLTRSLLQRYVGAGVLHRYTFDRAVYRFEPPTEPESIVDAALIAGPEAVASHVTALRLHDLTDLLPQADEFTLPRTRRSRRPPGPLKFYFTTTPLANEDITTLLDIRVTTPARSLVDVMRVTGHLDQIERGIAEALQRGVATELDFASALSRSRLSAQDRKWFEAAIRWARDALSASQA